MRKMENTNFEQSNIEYVQFWLLNPFMDPDNPNYDGGDLYFNFGEISEDILKDGLKSYENGIPLRRQRPVSDRNRLGPCVEAEFAHLLF